LETAPERCSLARENEYLEGTLRQILFKFHRIIFRVEQAEKIVRILYVRHGRQKTVGERGNEAVDDLEIEKDGSPPLEGHRPLLDGNIF